MPVAFHLLTHRHPLEIAQVLRALWHEDNTFVIHHDLRRPRAEHAALAELAREFSNVVLQKPTPVLWGRFSLYAAQQQGLRLALGSDRQWTHWVNLSGQCQPLQSPARIQEFLAANRDTSFVRHAQPLMDGDWDKPELRLTRRYLDSPLLDRCLRLPHLGRLLRRVFRSMGWLPSIPGVQRALPSTFTWYGGDNWVVLSRAAAEHVIHSPEARRIIEALRHSALPEESIFQSVLLNSPLAPQVRNAHLRCIDWQRNMPSPHTFTTADFPRLQAAAAEGCLFARKFDAQRDPALLARIERELLLSHASA